MSMKKTLSAVALSSALIAGNLAATTSSASADSWRHGHGSYSRYDDGPRHFRGGKYKRHGHYRHHRRNSGNGAAIALGVSALVLGAIIASESNRDRSYRDYHD